MEKLSKTEVKREIEKFFKNIKNKNYKEVKKLKRLSMRHSIKLGKNRKLFCKKCYTPYKNPKVRIKKGIKSIECQNCGYVNRWKI